MFVVTLNVIMWIYTCLKTYSLYVCILLYVNYMSIKLQKGKDLEHLNSGIKEDSE